MLAGVGFGTPGVGSGAAMVTGSGSSGSRTLTGIFISAFAGTEDLTGVAVTGGLEIQWGTISILQEIYLGTIFLQLVLGILGYHALCTACRIRTLL